MNKIINAKTLRAKLREILRRASRGERFSVIYRSKPVCQIVPVDSSESPLDDIENDSLYGAPPVGRSKDQIPAERHDEILYPHRKR